MRDAPESYPSCAVSLSHDTNHELSVHASMVAHLARATGRIKHAVAVRWLDVVMTMHVINLIATIVSLARHLVDGSGVASSHTVGSEAARYRESVRSHWC